MHTGLKLPLYPNLYLIFNLITVYLTKRGKELSPYVNECQNEGEQQKAITEHLDVTHSRRLQALDSGFQPMWKPADW